MGLSGTHLPKEAWSLSGGHEPNLPDGVIEWLHGSTQGLGRERGEGRGGGGRGREGGGGMKRGREGGREEGNMESCVNEIVLQKL